MKEQNWNLFIYVRQLMDSKQRCSLRGRPECVTGLW